MQQTVCRRLTLIARHLATAFEIYIATVWYYRHIAQNRINA